MTIEEKIGQMMQISFNQVDKKEAEEWILKRNAGSFLHILGDNVRNLQRLTLKTRHRIPLILGIDAVHGHALHNGATIFPSQLAMSCSWDPELIEKAGRVTAKEVIADGLNMTFSPVLCIGRDLRWGRIDETFGEDPYLIGTLASALIRGYQGKSLADEGSIASCVKHYIAYGESVDVTNTGDRDGTEIVQSYVNDLVSSVMTPVKELVGFKRVEIKACETKTVSILLPVSQLCIVDENLNYIVEPGLFEIMAGSDSRDEVLLKEILKVI